MGILGFAKTMADKAVRGMVIVPAEAVDTRPDPPTAPAKVSDGAILIGEPRREVAGLLHALKAGQESRDRAAQELLQRAEAELAEAQRRHDAACAAVVDAAPTHDERVREEELRAMLVNGRPELADRLRAKCRAEAELLFAWEAAKLPGSPGAPVIGGRPKPGPVTVVSNQAHVEARRAAVAEVSRLVDRWTRNGEYATEAELQALFDAAWSNVPRIPAVTELVRARRGGAPLLGGLPEPPAVA